MSTVPWGEFTQDPRSPEAAGLRAGDRDRDVVLRVLADGYADGRLTKDEYDERADATAAAKTLGELPPLIIDLVPHTPQSSTGRALATSDELHRRAVGRWEEQRREALTGFLIANVVCWVIWAATGFGFPWAIFVTLGTGIMLLQVQLRRKDIVAQELRRLEKKQQKALRARPDTP